MKAARVGIVGAGPGGLTSAMILAHRGFDVTVFEQKDRVGGRNAPLHLGPYTFDTGPTDLMRKFSLEEMIQETGRQAADYLDFMRLNPMYRLKIGGREFCPSGDPEETKAEVERLFPGNGEGIDRFLEKEGKRFDRLLPCLQKPYDSLLAYLSPTFLRALPRMSLGRTVFQNLGKYFDHDDLKVCFAFQSKYLGMSPWTCPAFFTMLSYIEHAFGIYHVIGGLNRISAAMARVVEEERGQIRLNEPVAKLVMQGRRATGLRLTNGEVETFDQIILNADFGHAMCELVPEGVLGKYSPEKLKKRPLSCSTFMLYLGVKGSYEQLPHHNVIFAEDYQRNVQEISEEMVLSDDPSFYVQNASATDPTLGPEGHSTIYVLVPCPNVRSGIDWQPVAGDYADTVLELVEEKGGFTDLRQYIVEKKIITPADWQGEYDVYEGATFSLAHTIGQLLYFRPHNRFQEIEHCYLVGGGTHPGSGLPTIYESGRITANMISARFGVPYERPSPLPDSIGI